MEKINQVFGHKSISQTYLDFNFLLDLQLHKPINTPVRNAVVI